MKVIKVIKLQNTQVEQDYNGSGYSLLVCKNNIPQKLIYIPEEYKDNWENIIHIDENHVKEITETTKVYYGMTSCWEFCVMEQVFPKV